MNRDRPRKTLWWGIGLVVLGLAGVSVYYVYGPGPAAFPGKGEGGFDDKASRILSGEQIYFFGIDGSGKRISTVEGPQWLYDLGGSCANCHGPDGRGGFPVTAETRVKVDIRYSILTSSDGQGHDGGAGGSHPYTEEDIRRAVTGGLKPDGGRLDTLMPRWEVSEDDLLNLVEFLKTLG